MCAKPRVEPLRVLFVGDSFTYANDLDQHVKALSEAADLGRVIAVDRAVRGGSPLKALWKKTDARKRIASGAFDVVVLQEDLPETDVATFHDYAVRFQELANVSGARLVLFMAWSYDRLGWISMEAIVDAHRQIAAKLRVQVAPVGFAWQRALSARPDLNLYAEDGEHPSLAGTYLAAAVVFAALWNRSPADIEYSTSLDLDKKDAVFLRRAAWEAMVAYDQNRWAGEPAMSSLARSVVIEVLFRLLDIDEDGFLNSAELKPFEDFVGFHGDDMAWCAEFACLCAELRCSEEAGVSMEGLRKLVDNGTQTPCVFSTDCTTEELHEFLVAQRLVDRRQQNSSPSIDRVVIVPGNGGGSVLDANWYGWLAGELGRLGVQVALQDMPDPVLAREARWLPFITNELAGGFERLPRTIVVGHSSGAAAAMRLAERHPVGGIILVAAYTSDLGDRTERKSGYFSRPWVWAQQRDNCGFVVQFASCDDPFLPIEEQRAVRDGLIPKVEYHEFARRSHFFDAPFWELLDVLKSKLGIADA